MVHIIDDKIQGASTDTNTNKATINSFTPQSREAFFTASEVKYEDGLNSAALKAAGITYDRETGLLKITFTKDGKESISTASLGDSPQSVTFSKGPSGNLLVTVLSPTDKDGGYNIDQIAVKTNRLNRPQPTLSSSKQYDYSGYSVNMYDDLSMTKLKQYGLTFDGTTPPYLSDRTGTEISLNNVRQIDFSTTNNGGLVIEVQDAPNPSGYAATSKITVENKRITSFQETYPKGMYFGRDIVAKDLEISNIMNAGYRFSSSNIMLTPTGARVEVPAGSHVEFSSEGGKVTFAIVK